MENKKIKDLIRSQCCCLLYHKHTLRVTISSFCPATIRLLPHSPQVLFLSHLYTIFLLHLVLLTKFWKKKTIGMHCICSSKSYVFFPKALKCSSRYGFELKIDTFWLFSTKWYNGLNVAKNESYSLNVAKIIVWDQIWK